MDTLARKLGLRTDNHIFFVSAGLTIALLILFLVFQDWVGNAFGVGREWIVTNLGWFFIIGVTVWLVFLIWVAVSKYGRLRLGEDDDRPEYSNLSWFAMLFAGGIGTVLMFWGVAEPISHFSAPPFDGVEPYSVEASQDAMSISLYHLSLHTWAIFTLPGLAFGFFIYRQQVADASVVGVLSDSEGTHFGSDRQDDRCVRGVGHDLRTGSVVGARHFSDQRGTE